MFRFFVKSHRAPFQDLCCFSLYMLQAYQETWDTFGCFLAFISNFRTLTNSNSVNSVLVSLFEPYLVFEITFTAGFSERVHLKFSFLSLHTVKTGHYAYTVSASLCAHKCYQSFIANSKHNRPKSWCQTPSFHKSLLEWFLDKEHFFACIWKIRRVCECFSIKVCIFDGR